MVNQTGTRPTKASREQVKEELRRCFVESDPEAIYRNLQETARQSRYAYALISGYLDRLIIQQTVEDDHGVRIVFFL